VTDGGRRLPLAVGTLALAGTAYLRVHDPHDPATRLPGCPSKRLTGLDCPGCGGLRLVNDLAHADLRRAAADNLFLLIAGPLLAGLVLRWARARRRGEEGRLPPRVGWVLGGAAAGWMVLRNQRWWPLRPT
jgi:hypothetical protein